MPAASSTTWSSISKHTGCDPKDQWTLTIDAEDQLAQHLRRGEHLLEIGRPAQAVEHFQRALGVAPGNAIVLCHLAHAFLLLGDRERSLDYARKATAADPNEEWSYRLQAHLHLQADRRTSAYEAARRAVEIDPESAAALSTMAQCAFYDERIAEAKLLGNVLVSKFPTAPEGHRVLAEIAAFEEDLEKAGAGYEKVLELDPEDDGAMAALADIRNKTKQYGASASLLRGAVHADPTSESRRGDLHDSMSRFALFGEPRKRSRSVAAWLSGAFVIYSGMGILLAGNAVNSPVAAIVYVLGVPLLLLIAIPLLRLRFLKGESHQLSLLYKNLSRAKSKRNLLAILVGIVTIYAMAGFVYRSEGDPIIFIYPAITLIAVVWLYLAAVTMYFAYLVLSDTWNKSVEDTGRSRLSIEHAAVPLIFVVSFVWLLTTESKTALILACITFVLAGTLYFRRYPLGVAIAAFLGGIVLVILDTMLTLPQGQTPPGVAGVLFSTGAFVAILYLAYRRYRDRKTRQQLATLLGVSLDEIDPDKTDEKSSDVEITPVAGESSAAAG